MIREKISTGDAPQTIGAYSQGIRAGGTVYLAGQIGLNPSTMEMEEGIDAQIHRVFRNLGAVAAASGGSLNDVVKLTIYLTNLGSFGRVNEIMASYFTPPLSCAGNGGSRRTSALGVG